MNKEKGIAAIILGKMKPKEESKEDDSMGLESAMDALIEAIGSKDSKAAAIAFKDAVSMCDYSEDKSEE